MYPPCGKLYSGSWIGEVTVSMGEIGYGLIDDRDVVIECCRIDELDVDESDGGLQAWYNV